MMSKIITWFDIESTGKNKATDRIIQLSLIKTRGIYEIIDKKKFYCNPDGVAIHPEAFAAHGISDEMVATCLPFRSLASSTHKYISDSDIIAGFNIKLFDIPMLAEEFARCSLKMPNKPIIDNAVIFKKQEQRNLTAALKFYCGEDLNGAHDAENDVIATIKVAQGQVFRYGFDNSFPIETIEDILIKESFYENENPVFDYHNRIILNSEGVPIWNFGKYRDKNIPIKQDPSYCDWCLNLPDFPATTKILIRKILNNEI
jgi:DNA polymerase-3 subunit epsilon